MARRIRAFDWSITPLGPFSGWPQSLRTVVDLMLDASFPTYVWWGPELIQFYNDPAIDVNGSKHPGLLGTPARTAWPDLWGMVGGIAERVLATGRPERGEDLSMGPDRGGPAETAWFTFSYNALRTEDGIVSGMFITGIETTNRMRAEVALHENEERQAFLLKLSDTLRPLADPVTVQTTAAGLLGRHLSADNSNYYEIDANGWAIRSLGYVDSSAALPDRFPLTDLGQQWADSFAARETVVINDVATDKRFSDVEREAWQANLLCATIGVPLVKEGRLRAAFGVNTAEPRQWTDSEIALVEEVVERTWAAVERARAEAAMRESEARLRHLFNTMRQGYHECEMIRDAEGRAIDYRLTAMNPAFEQLVGVPVADAVGRTAREIVPGLDDWWVELFDEVVKAGERRVDEYEVPQLGRWYRIDAYPKGGDRAAALFDDITERKLAEAALRESEERKAFLLKLSDALRPLTDPVDVQATAASLLGRHLGVDRSNYYEIDADGWVTRSHGYVSGEVIVPERMQLNDWGQSWAESYLTGRTDFVSDIATDDRWSVAEREKWLANRLRAALGVPLLKGGRLRAILGLNNAEPHHWTSLEIALAKEVAERTWAAVEQARAEIALRDSEARFRQFSDESTNILWIRNAVTLRMEFASPAFDRIYGIPGPDRGGDGSLRTWVRLIEPECRKTVLGNFRLVRAGERVEHEFRVRHATNDTLRWVHNTDFPLRDAAGIVRWIAGLGADITDAREATDRQGVLVAELQHRTRNLIAVVRSLSDRTLGNAASLDDFKERFRPRLAALSRVQGLLSHLANGERVTFKDLLCAELAAHGATNGEAHKVTLDGPDDVLLRSATVQTFALALHELATNAAKYGALEAPDGHLFVSWRVEPAMDGAVPRLHVEWRETGVAMPEVNAPARGSGYGRELIERALPYQLKAKTTYEMGPDGVRCTIALPIAGGGG